MKRRVYFSLLISAIAVLVALGTGASKGLTGQARSQVLPEDWRGIWEVTVAYRDSASGELVATDVSTAAICPGEPIIPPQLSTALLCSGEPSDSEISLWCRRTVRSPILGPGCNETAQVSLESNRDGNVWNGAGSWSVFVSGNCASSSRGQDFVVSGTRISSEAACDGPPSSLLQSFFAHSELVPFLGNNTSHRDPQAAQGSKLP